MSDRKAASCEGKTPYVSATEAHNQLKRRKQGRKLIRNNRGVKTVYKCRFCKFWHIGRTHL